MELDRLVAHYNSKRTETFQWKRCNRSSVLRQLVADRNAELDTAAAKIREKELGIPTLTKQGKKSCVKNKTKVSSKAQSKLMCAIESLRRANDGLSFDNWDNFELGYAISQLTRAATAALECIEMCNAETAGANEGAPPVVVPPAGEPSNGTPQDEDDPVSFGSVVAASIPVATNFNAVLRRPLGDPLECPRCKTIRITEHIGTVGGENSWRRYTCDNCYFTFEKPK